MKKQLMWLATLLLVPATLICTTPAHAGAGVSINLPGFGLSVGPGGVGVNVGLPWVVASTPVPVPAPVPVYAYPETVYEEVVVEETPEFVLLPQAGFYVAVGVPDDLFFYNNSYYVCRGNTWYNSLYYNGPWTRVYYGNVPYALNRLPFERIRHYRDTYYGHYRKYGSWKGHHHFRPARRNVYQKGHNRHNRNYATPRNQRNNYKTGYRAPNKTRQGAKKVYTSNSPTRRANDKRTAYTGHAGKKQSNRGRTVYYRPNGANKNHGPTSARKTPSVTTPGRGGRTVYARPAKGNTHAGQNNGSRSNNHDKGNNYRHTASSHNVSTSGPQNKSW